MPDTDVIEWLESPEGEEWSFRNHCLRGHYRTWFEVIPDGLTGWTSAEAWLWWDIRYASPLPGINTKEPAATA